MMKEHHLWRPAPYSEAPPSEDGGTVATCWRLEDLQFINNSSCCVQTENPPG